MGRTQKQKTGARGESIAIRFLLEKGYVVIERNYLVRGGEIDIVAWKDMQYGGKTLCFIEVKTRAKNDGSAERATDWKKRKHMARAAKMFCLERKIPLTSTPIQFEHITVIHTQKQASVVGHYVIPM